MGKPEKITETMEDPDELGWEAWEWQAPAPDAHPYWCKCQRVCGGDQ